MFLFFSILNCGGASRTPLDVPASFPKGGQDPNPPMYRDQHFNKAKRNRTSVGATPSKELCKCVCVCVCVCVCSGTCIHAHR